MNSSFADAALHDRSSNQLSTRNAQIHRQFRWRRARIVAETDENDGDDDDDMFVQLFTWRSHACVCLAISSSGSSARSAIATSGLRRDADNSVAV